MQVGGFTIDFTTNRASISFTEHPENVYNGASGIVQVPIKSKPDETIDDAKRHSRIRAAEALEAVVKALKGGEIP